VAECCCCCCVAAAPCSRTIATLCGISSTFYSQLFRFNAGNGFSEGIQERCAITDPQLASRVLAGFLVDRVKAIGTFHG
jgi:hypothetical protein